MKKAVQIMAQGFIDGGVEQYFNFPGFYSQQLFTEVGGQITSVNEKISYEAGWGSSMSGKRTLVTSKNVGLNDMADPFLNSHLVGVNGGLVLTVFDDVDVEGSQCRLDSRNYYDFYGGLWFEPFDGQNLYDCCYDAFRLSEQFQIPVVIRITNNILNMPDGKIGSIQYKIPQKGSKKLANDHKSRVVHPTNYLRQNMNLREKNTQIQNYIDSIYPFQSNADKVVFGPSNYPNYKAQEIIQLYTLPLPNTLLRQLQISEVLEHGDAVVYDKIQQALYKGNGMKSTTGGFINHANGYITSTRYERLFLAIKDVGFDCVVGDLGEYTSDNLKTIDYCLSFGSAISVAMGLKLAGSNPICVIGDGAYYHSGKNVLPELKIRNMGMPIILFQNGGSQGTGGQHIPHDADSEVNNGYEVVNFNLNTFDYYELISILKKSKSITAPMIINIAY